MIDRLTKLYNQATDQQFQEGMNWYQMVHTFASGLATKYGINQESASAIIAVLSPQLRWDKNELAAIAICNGEIPIGVLKLSVAKAQALFANAKSSNPLSIWDVNATSPKGNSIKAIGGLKVTSFAHNIITPFDKTYVTCDSHMLEAYLGRTATTNELSALGRRKVYNEVSNAIKKAAKKAGLLPLDFQAVVWMVQKETKVYAHPIHKANNHSGHVLGKV